MNPNWKNQINIDVDSYIQINLDDDFVSIFSKSQYLVSFYKKNVDGWVKVTKLQFGLKRRIAWIVKRNDSEIICLSRVWTYSSISVMEPNYLFWSLSLIWFSILHKVRCQKDEVRLINSESDTLRNINLARNNFSKIGERV